MFDNLGTSSMYAKYGHPSMSFVYDHFFLFLHALHILLVCLISVRTAAMNFASVWLNAFSEKRQSFSSGAIPDKR